MSYILDALKKSERERRRSSVPDPLTVQEPHSAEKKTRPVRSYLIVIIIIVGTLLSGLWFGIWFAKRPPEMQTSVNQPAAVLKDQNEPRIPKGKNSDGESERHDARNHSVENTGKPVRETSSLKGIGKISEAPVRGRNMTTRDTMTSPPAEAQSAHETEKELPPPDKNRLYSLQELPGAIRQKLPDFSFSVFLYTEEPASRTVRVNGVMMKEGQYVTDGLKLDEILPDGVIFNYMNYRFRVGIP